MDLGGTAIATFEFGSEGIDFYVPGSGILFEEGIYLDSNSYTKCYYNIYVGVNCGYNNLQSNRSNGDNTIRNR